MSTQEDSDEPGAPTVTPSCSSPTRSPDSRSPRSPVAEVVAQLSGAAVSILCAIHAARLVACHDVAGPWGVPLSIWGLAALVVIGAPTSVYQVRRLVQAIRGRR